MRVMSILTWPRIQRHLLGVMLTVLAPIGAWAAAPDLPADEPPVAARERDDRDERGVREPVVGAASDVAVAGEGDGAVAALPPMPADGASPGGGLSQRAAARLAMSVAPGAAEARAALKQGWRFQRGGVSWQADPDGPQIFVRLRGLQGLRVGLRVAF